MDVKHLPNSAALEGPGATGEELVALGMSERRTGGAEPAAGSETTVNRYDDLAVS